MSIRTTCACGQGIQVPDDMAGRSFACPRCGSMVRIDAPVVAKRPCPYCAMPIAASDAVCPHCHEQVAPAEIPTLAAEAPAKKCPACGGVVSPAALNCRWCRSSLRTPPPVAVGAPPMAPIPWADPSQGAFSGWWKTWAGTQFEGDSFWRRVRWSDGSSSAIKYLLFGTLLSLLPNLLCMGPQILLRIAGESRHGSGAMSGAFYLGFALAFPVLVFVGAILGAALQALFIHLFALMLGARGGLGRTFEAVSYCSGTWVWGLVPCIGGLGQLVFFVISMTHAMSAAHGITKGRAAAAVILPVVTLMALCCGAGILFFMAVFASVGGR